MADPKKTLEAVVAAYKKMITPPIESTPTQPGQPSTRQTGIPTPTKPEETKAK